MAEKSFGVEQLNVLGSGTPTISAPTTLNLDCHTVGVSTSLTVGANLSVSGISTIAQPADSNPIANWTITNYSNSAYRFTGPGQSGTDDDPNLYLVRGQRYIFKHNATVSHPIQIRVSNGGAAYTDGITYSDPSNNVTTHGNNLIFNVQHDAPARLYYQCTSHGPMIGNIYIIGGPQVISGVVTATSFNGDLVGTIQTAAQTNITSLGTLSSTAINGNLTISDSILHLGDLNTKMQFPSDDTISFTTSNIERVRIDSDGRLLFGATSSSSPVRGVFRGFAGDGGAGQGIIHLEVNKTTTNCGIGENLGSIRFGSNEGHIGALIGVQAESAWSGSTDLPSYINFYTCPDGSNTLTERLRIASNGQVSISNDGTTDGLLTIKGNSDQVNTPSIRLLDGSDTREVSITNISGDFVASVHGNDNAIHGHIKMFESGILDINNGGASGTNTNRLRIDTSGRVSIGRQSSALAYGSTNTMFEVKASDASNSIFETATFRGGADHNGAGARVRIVQGTHRGLVLEGGRTSNAAFGAIKISDQNGGLTSSVHINSSGTWFWGKTSQSSGTAGVELYKDGPNFMTRNGTTVLGLNNQAGTNGDIMRFYFQDVHKGSLNFSSGSFTATTASDYRLKDNDTPITDGIFRIKKLRPVRFNWRATHDDPTKIHDGFIAHELQQVVPDCVYGEKDSEITERGEGYQTISREGLVPLLTAALKEEISKREALEARVAALESS